MLIHMLQLEVCLLLELDPIVTAKAVSKEGGVEVEWKLQVDRESQAWSLFGHESVSYTHLTLPTKRIV